MINVSETLVKKFQDRPDGSSSNNHKLMLGTTCTLSNDGRYSLFCSWKKNVLQRITQTFLPLSYFFLLAQQATPYFLACALVCYHYYSFACVLCSFTRGKNDAQPLQ